MTLQLSFEVITVKKLVKIVSASALMSVLAVQANAGVLPDYQKNSAWFKDAEQNTKAKNTLSIQNQQNTKAKSVILFVGDGMGVSTLTASRILEGQQNGQPGEENLLSFEKFNNAGLIKTYNTNQQTPDSAGTMTAMVSGVKTKAGVIGIGPNALRGNCESTKGYELTSVLELAEMQGKSTGVVSTARITHATPAATYARSPERNWESDDKLTDEAKKNGCKDIATQLVEFSVGNGLDVAMGGGRRHFFPNTMKDLEGKSGKRKDGVDLREVWKTNNPQGVYVEDQASFDAIPASASKVFGLFNSSHMQYEADRKNDVAGEPSLTEMTEKAIQVLKKNPLGYVLVIESGRIDHGHHAGSAYNALTDTIEFSNAVAKAKAMTSEQDTLILVTADHSHVFTIAGYPTRGNPILGKVVGNDKSGTAKADVQLAKDGMPYTTLGYTNGLGFRDLGTETNADVSYGLPRAMGRVDLTNVDTTSSGFHQEALIPTSSETHAGEDISIHGTGPGAQWLQGVMEQNMVFHIMNSALELNAIPAAK